MFRFLLVMVSLGLASGAVAQQGTVSTKSRAALLQSQIDLLDGRAADQYKGSVRLQPQRVIIPGTPDALRAAGNIKSPYLETARRVADRAGVPEMLFLRLVTQESRWNPKALSPKGAIGLAQLMPDTARLLRVDPHDPVANLEGGAKYLRRMYDRFGSWPLALAAYNAGPEAVAKHGGIPPYAETQNYVNVIWGAR